MRRYELDGPPWVTYVDPDAEYVRRQAQSVGSGLLGGWSQVEYGGSFGARSGTEKEVREAIAQIAKEGRSSR